MLDKRLTPDGKFPLSWQKKQSSYRAVGVHSEQQDRTGLVLLSLDTVHR
jgi:hypothetical protein